MLRKGYKEVTDVRADCGRAASAGAHRPETGRKALFLGRRPNSYIVGMEVAESEALLDALWVHATQLRFAMCHEWQVGDLLMWNNLSVLHRRDPFDPMRGASCIARKSRGMSGSPDVSGAWVR